jgi:hypothetical protein
MLYATLYGKPTRSQVGGFGSVLDYQHAVRGTLWREPPSQVGGLVWFGLVWFGLVWFGLVWFGLVWFGLDRFQITNIL